jgi:YggT family protein
LDGVTVVSVLATVVYFALLIFWLFMLARLVIDLVRLFARRWRPQGAGLVLAEAVYAVTDPPIKLVRRVIPPLRFGNVALDLAWTIVALVVLVLMTIAGGFR